MNLKTKNIAIFSIVSIYFIGMMASFFGTYLEHYQIVRQEIQTQKIASATTLSFTNAAWNSFDDKDEILFHNQYYDVVSYQKSNDKIIAKVVKDSTENNFRIVANKILKKHKNPISDKKNNFGFSKHIAVEQLNFGFKPNFIPEIEQNFDLNSNQKTKNFIFIVENPPC